MHILNFAHPLTEAQQAQIEQLAGQPITQIINHQPHFTAEQALSVQVAELVDVVGFSSHEWQTLPILLNPPGFAPAVACLLAEIHGRSGYFPATLYIRAIKDSLPVQYEVAQILNLQTIREAAREQRNQGDHATD